MKWFGALLVVAGCGGFGFLMALSIKREVSALRQLIRVTEFMHAELEYRLTPLPELCCKIGRQFSGCIGVAFQILARELEGQVAPDVTLCMDSVVKKTQQLPKQTASVLQSMGKTLGLFDLPGQIQGLQAIREECRYHLEALEKDKRQRLRSYQTLGLCAGAALAILFM